MTGEQTEANGGDTFSAKPVSMVSYTRQRDRVERKVGGKIPRSFQRHYFVQLPTVNSLCPATKTQICVCFVQSRRNFFVDGSNGKLKKKKKKRNTGAVRVRGK